MNVLELWRRFARWPGGAWLFSRAVGWRVPYGASLGVRVGRVEAGRAEVALPFRRRVKNHFGTVHAAALAHLGEMTANLALMTRQPAGGRWTVSGLRIRFVSPGRGAIKAVCSVPEVSFASDEDLTGLCTLTDRDGEVVAEVEVDWRVGPRRKREALQAA